MWVDFLDQVHKPWCALKKYFIKGFVFTLGSAACLSRVPFVVANTLDHCKLFDLLVAKGAHHTVVDDDFALVKVQKEGHGHGRTNLPSV